MIHARKPSSVAAVAFETLEARRQFSAVYPTPTEQYAVELINRARANPTAEAQRYVGYVDVTTKAVYDGDLNEGLAAGTISADAKQPLAINPYLVDSARSHSAWMIANSTFSHDGINGSNPGQRMDAAGYPSSNWGENLAINFDANTLDEFATATTQQRSLFTDQSISDRGHRTNMMDADRNEIGVGFASGPYNYPGVGTVNALAGTHDTATTGKLFLTGVAFTDSVSDDDFYTPGEGLASVNIVAKRQSDGLLFATQTWASGGYSLELPAGTYDVTGSGGGLASAISYGSVTIDTVNVKKDFADGVPLADGATVQVGDVRIRGTALVATGTDGADVIGVFVDSTTAQYVVGLNGDVTRWDASLIDSVAVLGLGGNDRLVVSDGVLHSYMEGGAGKDTMIGGPGDDVMYGNGGIDRLEGNGGNDKLVGENGNDVIYGGAGNDSIYGGVGNDIIDAGNGNDRVYGGPGDDVIAGKSGRDYLYGEGGADLLNGGTGPDTSDTDDTDTRIAIEVLV